MVSAVTTAKPPTMAMALENADPISERDQSVGKNSTRDTCMRNFIMYQIDSLAVSEL